MTEEKRSEYMKRLDSEFQDYQIGMCKLSPQQIMEKITEISDMKNAYEYLRSPDVPGEQLEYAMRAMKPLHEIAAIRKTVYDVIPPKNPIIGAIKVICERRMLDHGGIDQYTGHVPIQFYKNAAGVADILRLPRNRPDERIKVEKVIELTSIEYEQLKSNMLSAQPFIAENTDNMWFDSGGECWHCLLVKSKDGKEALLVEADGYDYARYAAFVEDVSKLDLKDVPVQQYEHAKGRQRKLAKQHKSPER